MTKPRKRIYYQHTVPATVERLLRQVGDNIRTARMRRRLRMSDLAVKAGVTRQTIQSIEAGRPGTGIGAYAAVLWALGLGHNLLDLANPDTDAEGKTLEAAERGERAHPTGSLSDDF